MNRKLNVLAAFLTLAIALMLTACAGSGGDTAERFAPAAPQESGSIAIPGCAGFAEETDSNGTDNNGASGTGRSARGVLSVFLAEVRVLRQ